MSQGQLRHQVTCPRVSSDSGSHVPGSPPIAGHIFQGQLRQQVTCPRVSSDCRSHVPGSAPIAGHMSQGQLRQRVICPRVSYDSRSHIPGSAPITGHMSQGAGRVARERRRSTLRFGWVASKPAPSRLRRRPDRPMTCSVARRPSFAPARRAKLTTRALHIHGPSAQLFHTVGHETGIER